MRLGRYTIDGEVLEPSRGDRLAFLVTPVALRKRVARALWRILQRTDPKGPEDARIPWRR